MGAFLGSWREWTHNKYWRYEWLLAGGCEIIYNFFLTLAISLLFWPRQPSGERSDPKGTPRIHAS